MQPVTINKYLLNALIVLLVVSLYANVRLVMRDLVGLPLCDTASAPIPPASESNPKQDATPYNQFTQFTFPEDAVTVLQSPQGDSAFGVAGDDLKAVYAKVDDDTLYLRIEGYAQLNPALGYELYLKGDQSYQLRVHPQRQYLFVEQTDGSGSISNIPKTDGFNVYSDDISVYVRIPRQSIPLGQKTNLTVTVFDPRTMEFDRQQFKQVTLDLPGG